MHNGREFELEIEKKDDSYVASFKRHGYSYTPVYWKTITSLKSINSVENRIRFSFKLTKEYYVSFRFAVNNSKVSAYVFESWNATDSWKALEINGNKVTKEETRVVTKEVAITFYNQTKSKVLVYSIAADGKETKERILTPGEACVQDTFSTQKWQVRMKGRDNLNYTATKDNSQLVRIK